MAGAGGIVLGIETSCDETAVAVVEDGVRVRSSEVHTQAELHRPWGGVVPELASRDHLARVLPLVDRALERAGIRLADVDGIAVTAGPGLIGALLVGVQAAKGLAAGAGKPVVGVNHLEGHLLAIRLGARVPDFPFVALVVSGGHTALYEASAPGAYRLLGQTRDDAAGEAFDKVGKLLGVGYPGGPVIDRLARGGDPRAVRFPRGLPGGSLDFSFSGLKTAVARHLQLHGRPEGAALSDLCASFQEAVVDVLVRKALLACARTGVPRLVLGGGVVANGRLREAAAQRAAAADVDLHLPERWLCTDNAAMIAVAGARRLALDESDGHRLDARASWPL